MKVYYYLTPPVIAFIAFIMIRRKKNKLRLEAINYSAEGRNIALSITKCKELYKQLAKAIHPDRFEESQRELTDELMRKINAAKYDYQQLCVLRTEAEMFLNKKL